MPIGVALANAFIVVFLTAIFVFLIAFGLVSKNIATDLLPANL